MVTYREGPRTEVVEAREHGLVADMVRQFADRFAFWRELTQNAIDAGATRLEARAELGDDGAACLSLEDDGSGMSRAIVEGPLLTLFSSSKDGRPGSDKIGKYGVGFVSVFALEPRFVTVETTHAGQGLSLRLLPDHSYELRSMAPGAHAGTTVRLHLALALNDFVGHAQRSHAALARWCRHIPLPLHLTVVGAPVGLGAGATPTDGGRGQRVRVDRPFGVEAIVTVEDERDGERYVLGPSGAGAGSAALPRPRDVPGDEADPTFAGFYNRGLMLAERGHALHPALAGVRLKVMSPHLSHTISRDDVRRDAAYERVVKRAVRLAERRLGPALRDAIAAAAADVAAGHDAARYQALLRAAPQLPEPLRAGAVLVPLTDAVEGRSVWPLSKLGRRVPCCERPARLSAALCATGQPVVRATPETAAALSAWRPALVPIWMDHLLVMPPLREPAASDHALCQAVARALRAAGWRTKEVALGALEGSAPRSGALALGRREFAHLFGPGSDGARDGARHVLLRRRDHCASRRATHVVLVEDVVAVRAARALARQDVELAAALLARVLHVAAHGALDAKPSDALVAFAAEVSA